MARLDLFPGMVAYVDFGVNRGREQSGIQPGVIISFDDYFEARRELTANGFSEWSAPSTIAVLTIWDVG